MIEVSFKNVGSADEDGLDGADDADDGAEAVEDADDPEEAGIVSDGEDVSETAAELLLNMMCKSI